MGATNCTDGKCGAMRKVSTVLLYGIFDNVGVTCSCQAIIPLLFLHDNNSSIVIIGRVNKVLWL